MDQNFEILFKQFEKHLDSRLDRIESALSILATDNRENTKKVFEHEVKIEQNKIDIDKIANNVRAKNDTYDNKIDRIENTLGKYTGALIVISFVFSLAFFILNYFKK